ncbi:MarR family transcriptional regulator [Mycoplana sp. MJR14]|uniref:MarR family winged helix-turn-helix transcriptional regulator n=1 Tax=Mycoplana sp. MJR14 TaxID=3032583 RepID=UPI000DD78126|nr:MarR family transcriptional regulator [Mycoplana sp. MJR14]MDF1631821.1 MarR family transcriptional regulator [Mycoplana sp. MJR14]
MLPTNPRDVVLEELSRAGRKMRALFDARVRARGVTLSRARTLLILRRTPRLNQRELAEELDIETPTLVRLLDGMEKQGFIERRHVEGDRRAKQIVLTPEGEKAADEMVALAQDLRRDLLAEISDKDIATAVRVLQQISCAATTSCREGV